MTISTCPPPQGGSSAGRVAALAAASALSGLFLAACGGDGDSPVMPPPPVAITQVPASAAANSLALETFAFNLALTDNTEPLGLDNITTLPTSETEDPIATP